MARPLVGILVEEGRKMLPPTLFFFVVLNLLVLTVAVLSHGEMPKALSHVAATVGALLIGKAVLLADLLPFFERMRGRPLIHVTAWKAGLYILVAIGLHLIERLVSMSGSGQGIAASAEAAAAGFDWPRFLVIQIWLALLLFAYAGFREIAREMGEDRLRALFFSRRPGAKA